MKPQIEKFTFEGEVLQTKFVESSVIASGVICDVYSFPETQAKDLGIISIEKGMKTPLQRVLNGEKTIEGYISGEGRLTIEHTDKSQSVFDVCKESGGFYQIVRVGELMQWEATSDELVVFEICYPPYKEGRFENLT